VRLDTRRRGHISGERDLGSLAAPCSAIKFPSSRGAGGPSGPTTSARIRGFVSGGRGRVRSGSRARDLHASPSIVESPARGATSSVSPPPLPASDGHSEGIAHAVRPHWHRSPVEPLGMCSAISPRVESSVRADRADSPESAGRALLIAELRGPRPEDRGQLRGSSLPPASWVSRRRPLGLWR
jgi:hypothetical protein